MSYTAIQWLLIFFSYCFLGWVWESCYVSFKQRTWVNRGFLYGPWLPIYGFGAIIILFLTLPVREYLPLIYLFGMLGATALEYVTGAVMERLFHMRYWDYSGHPLNVNGHICLSVSLAWGVFSMLLVRILHPPVEQLILSIPAQLADLLGLCLTVLFTIDTTWSVRAALDMKALMGKLTESSQALEHVSTRLNAAVAQLNETSEQFRQRLEELEQAHSISHEQALQRKEEHAQNRREFLLSQLAKSRERKSERLAALLGKTELGLEAISRQLASASTETERERLEKLRDSLLDFQASLHRAEFEMAERKDRDFQRAVSILHRNPTAVSRNYREAFSLLKGMRKDRRKEKE